MTKIEVAVQEYERCRTEWIYTNYDGKPRPYVRDVMLKHDCVMVKIKVRYYGKQAYYDFLRQHFGKDAIGWFISSGGIWFPTQAEADLFSFYCETMP